MPALLSKLFKNAACLLIMNLGTLAALFAFSVLLARTLGREALGLYTLFTAMLMPFSYAVDLGQSTSLVQEMGRAPAAGNRILKNTLLLKILLGLAATAGLLLFSFFYFQKTEERSLFLIFGLLLLPRGLGATFEAAFRSRQKMAFPMWATVGHGALLVFTSWGLLRAGHALPTIIGLLVLLEIARMISLWLRYRREEGFSLLAAGPGFDRTIARESFATALPFFVTGLLGILHYRLDVMLLAALRGHAEVGVFGAAGSFVKVLRVAPSVIVASFFPAIAGMPKNSAQLRTLAAKTLRVQLALSLSLAVSIFLLADWLIAKTYDFPGTATILRVQVWSIIPLALYSTLVYVFFQAGKPAWNMGIMAAAVACNAVLNYLLMPRWGALGAAISSVASESLCCVLYFGCYFALQRSTLPESAVVDRAAGRVNSSAPCDTE
ncbi:MAG: flippase [candidate division KSB1 bacterium]|nr:flippase [candidate division KSB1 bacterium]MDZ7275883.1 flippase [candidate division KSB1 bacterium]MDZ7287633.1 flippase [candidate division KSB1 bacterium]MDZ7306795.1 flippase [candidate division KSB1 bacterium]MDZ7350611.1 flippase [candidate division KSB1 bacterium]